MRGVFLFICLLSVTSALGGGPLSDALNEGEGYRYPLVPVPKAGDLALDLGKLIQSELVEAVEINRTNLMLGNEEVPRVRARFERNQKLLRFRSYLLWSLRDPQSVQKFIHASGELIRKRFDRKGEVPANIRFYFSYLITSIVEMQKNLGILTPETVEVVGQQYVNLFKAKYWPKMWLKKEILVHFAQTIVEAQGMIPKNFWQLLDIPLMEVDTENEVIGEIHTWAGLKVRSLELLSLNFNQLAQRWIDEVVMLKSASGREAELEQKLELWRGAVLIFADLESRLQKSFEHHPFKQFLTNQAIHRGFDLHDSYQSYSDEFKARELSSLDRLFRRNMNSLLDDWNRKFETVKKLNGLR